MYFSLLFLLLQAQLVFITVFELLFDEFSLKVYLNPCHQLHLMQILLQVRAVVLFDELLAFFFLLILIIPSFQQLAFPLLLSFSLPLVFLVLPFSFFLISV